MCLFFFNIFNYCDGCVFYVVGYVWDIMYCICYDWGWDIWDIDFLSFIWECKLEKYGGFILYIGEREVVYDVVGFEGNYN